MAASRTGKMSDPYNEDIFYIRKSLHDPINPYLSFESVTFPGYYLRQANRSIFLHPLDHTDNFRLDAAFVVRAGLGANALTILEAPYASVSPNTVTIESFAYPNFYATSDDFANAYNNSLSLLAGTKEPSKSLFKLNRVVKRMEFNYLGCYMDREDKALPQYLGIAKNVYECAGFASKLKLQYFGMQNNAECYGGDDGFAKYGIAPEHRCMYQCTGIPGNGTTVASPQCGTAQTNAIYMVQDVIEEPVQNSLIVGNHIRLLNYFDAPLSGSSNGKKNSDVMDSTFIVREVKLNSSDHFVYLESAFNPGFFIRTKNYQLFLEADDGSVEFNRERTFLLRKGVGGLPLRILDDSDTIDMSNTVSLQLFQQKYSYIMNNDSTAPWKTSVGLITDINTPSNAIFKLMNVIKPTEYQFVGCFLDKEQHALPEYLGNRTNVRQCAHDAADKGFRYVGMQNNAFCFAGDSGFNKYGMLPTHECMYQCTGTPGVGKETLAPECGTLNSNAVFEVSSSKEEVATQSVRVGGSVSLF